MKQSEAAGDYKAMDLKRVTASNQSKYECGDFQGNF